MANNFHTLPRLLLVAAVAGIIAVGSALWGQDDWDAEEQVLAQPGVLHQRAAFEVPEETFDQWAFGGKTTAHVTKRLDSLLTLQMESIERACELSTDQKKKLQLAGRGDVKRYFGSVEEVRKKFREVRRDQHKINQIWQDIQPLQTRFNSGLFDESSLFHKVLKRTLDPDQSAQYEQQQRERRKFRYEARIQLAVTMMEKGVPLRDEQRKKFVKLLAEDAEPPAKFGQHDYYVVLYHAAKLPEEKLKPIFDDAQWRALTQMFAQAKGMEAHLKRNGFIQ
jgi:Zn-dependent oligopeptidase